MRLSAISILMMTIMMRQRIRTAIIIMNSCKHQRMLCRRRGL